MLWFVVDRFVDGGFAQSPRRRPTVKSHRDTYMFGEQESGEPDVIQHVYPTYIYVSPMHTNNVNI